jgi:dihydrofolate reductase
MRNVIAFEQVSLDGFFVDRGGDMSWAHQEDPEWNAFSAENAQGNGELLFGRVTYEMMAAFWPSPAAKQSMPEVAESINRMPKIVFSRTLGKAEWNNTRVVKTGMIEEVQRLKQGTGGELVILGSGTLVSQLTQAGLIDEYQLAINPLVLGKGRTLFESVERRVPLELIKSRAFKNGNVVLTYRARQ